MPYGQLLYFALPKPLERQPAKALTPFRRRVRPFLQLLQRLCFQDQKAPYNSCLDPVAPIWPPDLKGCRICKAPAFRIVKRCFIFSNYVNIRFKNVNNF
jgi:hypothetical protein